MYSAWPGRWMTSSSQLHPPTARFRSARSLTHALIHTCSIWFAKPRLSSRHSHRSALHCWRPPEGASGRETCVGADLGRGGARRRCVGSPYAGCQVGFAQRSGKWKLLRTPAGCVFESIGSACMAFRSWRLHGIQAECSWPRHRWTLQCRRGSLLCLVHTADSFHMALGSTTECSRSSHAGGSCRHYALRSSAVCAISSLSRA